MRWQPLRSTPVDLETFEPAAWKSLPDADPIGAVEFQGETIDGYDHYHVGIVRGVPVVTSWVDTSAFTPLRYARVATYPDLAPSAALGGAYTVARTVVWYTEGTLPALEGVERNVVRPWSEFVPPKRNVRDGALVSDEHWAATQAARSLKGWREYTDGVPTRLVKNGRLVGQRNAGLWIRPTGTRTYFHDSAGGQPNVHNLASAVENSLLTTTSAPVTVTATGIGGGGELIFTAASPANEPDAAGVWPAGTYRRQLDVTAIGSDLIFGMMTLGAGDGHFARVDSGLTTDVETLVQAEAAFGGPGLFMATTSGWAVAGAQTDRFENLIAAQRIAGHGNQTLSLQLNEADDFTDGPWVAAVAPSGSLVGFMSHF